MQKGTKTLLFGSIMLVIILGIAFIPKLSLTGNAIKETDIKDNPNLNMVSLSENEAEEEINSSLEIKNETLQVIIGGGWVKGEWQEMEKGIGIECGSWGNAVCIKTKYYSVNRTELKCPENYGKVSLSSFIPHEVEERAFICVIGFLAQKNSSMYITEKEEENKVINVGSN